MQMTIMLILNIQNQTRASATLTPLIQTRLTKILSTILIFGQYVGQVTVSGVGARSGFSQLISDKLPNLHTLDTDQCFPLKLYEKNSPEDKSTEAEDAQKDIFASLEPRNKAKSEGEYTIKDGITDEGLAHFQAAHPKEAITKENVFYYIYGLLHSEDYKKRYTDNLTKELPRIPCVKQAADFWAFRKTGRTLAEWHINYETVALYPVTFDCGKAVFDELNDADFYVTKMKFTDKNDKYTVIYNHHITLKDIPLSAYEYAVNGKPALEWVMERQPVTTHKDSGIVNDANDWAIEAIDNPRYPLGLFQRVITVSLETMKVVNALPKWIFSGLLSRATAQS